MIVVVGVLSGALVMALQKLLTNQSKLRTCREDLRILRTRIRSAGKAPHLRSLSRTIGGRYFWGSLKPSLVTVPLLTAVAWWADAQFAFQPVAAGEELLVRAHFEDGAEGFAHVVPAEGISVDSSIAPVSAAQASWKIKLSRSGAVTIRHSDRSYEVEIPIGSGAPAAITVFNRKSETRDQLQAVELGLTAAYPPAWWNLWLGWVGLYLWIATLSALLFKFLLRVA